MSEVDVHAALAAQLNTLGKPVAWENVRFTPTVGQAWLREKFSPARKVAASLGADGYDRCTGVYLVDVFSPAGAGRKDAEALTATVLTAFPRGGVVSSGGTQVRIERSYRTAAREEPDWYHVPVTVEFRADIPVA